MSKSILEEVIDMKGLGDRIKARLKAKGESFEDEHYERPLKAAGVYSEADYQRDTDNKERAESIRDNDRSVY